MVFVSYDRTGNILTADYAGEQIETNTYNELGLLTTVTTAEGDTLYQYDDASRLISVTQPNGETVNYTYDSHGNRSSMTYPNGKTVSYSYDEMNRLIAVKGVDGETTKYSYDVLGRRIATDGVKEDTVYAYDEVGNLTSQTTTGAYDLALEYAYDLSGRMTSESRTENGATLTSVFTYDPLGQLTAFTRSDGQSETYTYDPVGNMTAKTQNGVSTAMKYNAANQLVSSVSGTDKTTYTYDANGNLVRSENAGGARSYAYNALNLLQSFTREDGYSETYTYNANRLLSEIRTSEDLTTTLTWDILYGDGVVIGAAQNGEQTNYTYGLERISALTGKTRTEYVYDGRGSVAAEVSYNDSWYTFGGALARKNVVSKSYSPFGELLTENTSGFGYNGEYYNAVTGMIYLRARFYEPEMNRFSQKDTLRGSILDPVGLNRYLYCQSDPVNFADYNGLQMVNVCVADGGGSGRDNSKYARTTASSTTPSNQPPTFQEYLAQNKYDPFNPNSLLPATGSNTASERQSQGAQGSSAQDSGITRESPSVQDVTGNRGYSCGRERIGDGASQIIKGAFYVGVGIAALAVASTAGLPVILALFAAGITTGTVAYGAAEMGEGIDSIIYGSRGDTTTVVYNPLRDGVFGGNQNSYDAFGHAAISGSFGVGTIAPAWGDISSTASNLWNSTRNQVAVGSSGQQGGVRADFYVTPNGEVIPSTGYRYMSRDASYIPTLQETMFIEAREGTYFSFDRFDTPNPGALQVPHDASIRGAFDTLQIIDDIRIPYGSWNQADYLEPITRDFPQFGPGGATQAITDSAIKLDEITDLLN